MVAAAFAMVMAGCSNKNEDDKDEEIPFWDESYPEEIVEELVDVPAYIPAYGLSPSKDMSGYATIYYSRHMESLKAFAQSGEMYEPIKEISVERNDYMEEYVDAGRFACITASITNRDKVNPEYLFKVGTGEHDESHVQPPKTYIHQIKEISTGCNCDDDYMEVEISKGEMKRFDGWETMQTLHYRVGTLARLSDLTDLEPWPGWNWDWDCACYVKLDTPIYASSRILWLIGLPDIYKKKGIQIIFSGEVKDIPTADMYLPGRPVVLTKLWVKKSEK